MADQNSTTLEVKLSDKQFDLEILNLTTIMVDLAKKSPQRSLMDATFDARFKEYASLLKKRIGKDKASAFLYKVRLYGENSPNVTVKEYLPYLAARRF